MISVLKETVYKSEDAVSVQDLPKVQGELPGGSDDGQNLQMGKRKGLENQNVLLSFFTVFFF